MQLHLAENAKEALVSGNKSTTVMAQDQGESCVLTDNEGELFLNITLGWKVNKMQENAM